MKEPFKLFATGYRVRNFVSSPEDYTATRMLELTAMDGVMVQYSGLNPPAAVLYSTPLAGANGSVYNSRRLNTRNIVLTFTLLSHIQDNRLLLYEVFKTGGKVRLEYHGSRHAWIEGFVETIQANQFEKARKEVVQVSVICYDPLLHSVDTNTYTKAYNSNSTDWVINYGGDVPSGLDITIAFSGSVTNPYIYNQYDMKHGNGIEITGAYSNGTEILISTYTGKKDITYLGNSIVNDITLPADWFRIMQGKNNIRFGASSGSSYMTVTLDIVEQYEGV